MRKYHYVLFAFLTSVGLMSCSSDDSANNAPETARISVELTDAPGDYEEVLVEVEDVLIKRESSGNEDEGWESLGDIQAGVYDLLTLTAGNTQLLADSEIPAGYLHQMRLVLGDNNNIVVNGTSYTLKTPSAQQSGLKLMVGKEIQANTDYSFIIDFDVDQSVVEAGGTGNYNLHPVLRLSAVAETGSIEGSIHPTTNRALIVAQKGDTSVSAYTNNEGEFKLHGLPAGTYRVTVTPDAASGLSPLVKNNVEVQVENTTDLEVIFLD